MKLKFSKKKDFSATIIDAINEWSDYKEILIKKEINIIQLNKDSTINKKKKDGFFTSIFFLLRNIPAIDIVKIIVLNIK